MCGRLGAIDLEGGYRRGAGGGQVLSQTSRDGGRCASAYDRGAASWSQAAARRHSSCEAVRRERERGMQGLGLEMGFWAAGSLGCAGVWGGLVAWWATSGFSGCSGFRNRIPNFPY